MSKDSRDLPIGIFDSGLGGLTVVSDIMRALPGESIVYLGDTARCPYGPRDQAEVRGFVMQIARWLAGQGVKMVVVACNTGTAAGLDAATESVDVPVVGVIEPGAKAAVEATKTGRVGVIATTGTVESGEYSRSIRAIAPDVTVFSRATPKFVDIVEAGLRIGPGALEDWIAHSSEVFVRPAFYEMARDYLVPLKRADIDTLVLGCTHFPLLSSAIQQVMGPRVRLISSATETAREVARILEDAGLLADGPPSHRFYTTGDAGEFAVLGSRVLRREIERVEHVPLTQLEAGL
ncbi:MAG: glutamate racemase [Coriobacteriia bacterium]